MLSRARRLLGLSGLVLLLAGPALAYILPADFLLRKMADKRRRIGISRLTVTMECQRGQSARAEEKLYLKVPGRIRWEGPGDEVIVCQGVRCRHRGGGQQAVPAWIRHLNFFFVGPARQSAYQKMLKTLGVDTRRDTLSRFGGRVAVVLGAKSWERDRPQFWLDKDLFLPLRLFLKQEGALIDIAWKQWGSRLSGDWFPASLEVRRDGQPLLSCQVTGVDSRRAVPDKLFAP